MLLNTGLLNEGCDFLHLGRDLFTGFLPFSPLPDCSTFCTFLLDVRCHLLTEAKNWFCELKTHSPKVSGKAVLYDVQILFLGKCVLVVLGLEQKDIVGLLRRLAAAEDALDGESLLQILPRVDHQGDVHVVQGRELPEHLDTLILLAEPVNVPVPGPDHELDVVDDDMGDVVHVDSVRHRVQHLLHLVSAVEPGEIHRQLREPLGHLVKLLEAAVEVDEAELLEHHPDQPHVLHLEAAPECGHSLLAQVDAVLRHEGGLPASSPED